MRGLEKTDMKRGHTNGHVNYLTNSAQRAELVKITLIGGMLLDFSKCKLNYNNN